MEEARKKGARMEEEQKEEQEREAECVICLSEPRRSPERTHSIENTFYREDLDAECVHYLSDARRQRRDNPFSKP